MQQQLQRGRATTVPIWAGCDIFAWWRLLVKNRFAVHRSRWHVAAVVSAASILHTALRFAQHTLYGQRVAATPVTEAPLFIVGHWRTGTTLVHELLGRDPRHAFPTTYDCLAPHHFLITRSWLPQLFTWLAPTRRPMDNMAVGWGRPQEDELALCLLSQPSPYERMAFPNRPASESDALDLGGLSRPARRRWKTALYRFVQALTLANPGRRLVLKSPPHSCRIPTLLELFPGARFLHIVRNPYDIYPSTLHLWRTVYTTYGLQPPRWENLPEYVLANFVKLYERLEEGKHAIPTGHFHELRYEDLVRDPLGRLATAYQALGLGPFEPARPHVEAYMASVKDYETNRHAITRAEQLAISRRWGTVIQRFGYALRAE